jgi:hypothetical protein
MSEICIAFGGNARIAMGGRREVAAAVKERIDREPSLQTVIFDAVTSQVIELDLRGDLEDVLSRLAVGGTDAPEMVEARKPGRPKLGVVAREITLLPRHWEWLGGQPGGASVAIRKLVDSARTSNRSADRRRGAQEAAYRFMSAMAGDEAGFEEAARALFAGNRADFDRNVESWPPDVREHARKLAAAIEE